MKIDKRRVEDLAFFGGAPLFPFRHSAQHSNERTEQFFAYARQAFEERRLSNHGPLVQQLEEQLRTLHGTRHCITFANASMAIMIALRLLADERNGNVVVPAMSYRGLPHLVRWAGLTPKYCDIDSVGHTLSPDALQSAMDAKTVAVLAVDNVNALCDVSRIEAVTKRLGIPLLLDSVRGIHDWHSPDACGVRGEACVFSLNATKLINGFEGGYVTTNNDALAAKLKAAGNFGFQRGRDAELLGINAKLNEIHAAMALSSIPHVDALRRNNAECYETYQIAFADVQGVSFANYLKEPDNYSLILMKLDSDWPLSRADTQRLLNAEQVLVAPYYAPPLFEDASEFHASEADQFPVARQISREFLQIPVGESANTDDIRLLAAFFKFLGQHAEDIRRRLDG